MRIDVLDPGQCATARIHLEHGESVVAASGATIGMSAGVSLAPRAVGLVGGLRRLLGGTPFSPCELRAEGGPGEALLAPPLGGEMLILEVGPARWRLASGAFVAATGAVDVEPCGGRLTTFFAGAGLFVLEASGAGKVVLGGFGAIAPLEVDGAAVVDTGHVVAWDASLELAQHDGVGLWAGWLSGEVATCTFTGAGRVWVQSRNLSELGRRVGARLPRRGA